MPKQAFLASETLLPPACVTWQKSVFFTPAVVEHYKPQNTHQKNRKK
jgi:hypothetical protein